MTPRLTTTVGDAVSWETFETIAKKRGCLILDGVRLFVTSFV